MIERLKGKKGSKKRGQADEDGEAHFLGEEAGKPQQYVELLRFQVRLGVAPLVAGLGVPTCRSMGLHKPEQKMRVCGSGMGTSQALQVKCAMVQRSMRSLSCLVCSCSASPWACAYWAWCWRSLSAASPSACPMACVAMSHQARCVGLGSTETGPALLTPPS